MNEQSKLRYESASGSIDFAVDSDFWINDLSDASSVDISLTTVQSIGQIGSTVASSRVESRKLTINGTLFEPLDSNRAALIRAVSPVVGGRLLYTHNGETCYLEVMPEKTPIIEPGRGLQDFQMVLFAPYPFWRKMETVEIAVTGLDNLFHFTIEENPPEQTDEGFNGYTGGEWYLSRNSGLSFVEYWCPGNIPLEFELKVSALGPVRGIEFSKFLTGQSIKLMGYGDAVLQRGDYILISTRFGRRGIWRYRGDQHNRENWLRYMHPASRLDMALDPGKNILKVDVEEGQDKVEAKLFLYGEVFSGV